MNFLFTRQDLQRLVEPARFERRRMLAETIDDLYEYEWTCAGPSSTVFGAMRPLCTTGVLGCPLSATAPKEALHRSAPTQSQWGSATSAKSRTPNQRSSPVQRREGALRSSSRPERVQTEASGPGRPLAPVSCVRPASLAGARPPKLSSSGAIPTQCSR